MVDLPRPAGPLHWIGQSRKDDGEFPPKVREESGFALFLAQMGQHPQSAKPLKRLGFDVVEIVEDFDGDTFRTVYTVRFEKAVYVLHAFKKKAKTGIKTPQSEIELIKRQLRDVETYYTSTYGKES